MAASSPPSSRPTSVPSSAATPSTWSSSRRVRVAVAPPDSALVAPQRGAIEPLVHAPETVDPAGETGIRVIDLAVAQREGADAGALAQVRRHVGAGRRSDLANRCLAAERLPLLERSLHRRFGHRAFAPIVVLDPAAPLLELREGDAEVAVDVPAEGGRP